MKIADQVRQEISDFLTKSGSPQMSRNLALHLIPRWPGINISNVVETCRWLGFTVIGDAIYNLDE